MTARAPRRFAVAAVLAAAAGLCAAQDEQPFYVLHGADVAPLALLRGGQLSAFPREATPVPAARAPYYLFGAGLATYATLDGPPPTRCRLGRLRPGDGGPDAAILSAAPPRAMASATPRAVTPAERALLATMGKQVLARHRVPQHFITRLLGPDSPELRRSQAALPRRGNGKPLLFASYALEYDLAGRSGTLALTLLAEPNATGVYLPTFKEVDQGDGAAFRKFLTNADLDGDGVEELVLRAAGAAQSGYQLLARGQGKWRVIIDTGTDDC